jgi:hypothetical protein
MPCTRCGGIMNMETVYNAEEPRINVWRCVMCGDITDPVIQLRREERRADNSSNANVSYSH